MKIVDKTLVSVSNYDLKDGKFFNDKIKKVADGCFTKMEKLKSISLPNCISFGNDCIVWNENLEEIKLPNVHEFGKCCINGNKNLVKLKIPKVYNFGNQCILGNYKLDKLSLSNRVSFGDGCICSNHSLVNVSLSNIQNLGERSIRYNMNLKNIIFNGEKLILKMVDGYPFIVQQHRVLKNTDVYKGYNFIKIDGSIIEKTPSYVVQRGDFFSHGLTYNRAIRDLNYKENLQKYKVKLIKKNTIITPEYYRIITGACEMGTKLWIKENKINKNKYKASELLPLLVKTKAFGLETFKQKCMF